MSVYVSSIHLPFVEFMLRPLDGRCADTPFLEARRFSAFYETLLGLPRTTTVRRLNVGSGSFRALTLSKTRDYRFPTIVFCSCERQRRRQFSSRLHPLDRSQFFVEEFCYGSLLNQSEIGERKRIL
jgi:hypothetical protein